MVGGRLASTCEEVSHARHVCPDDAELALLVKEDRGIRRALGGAAGHDSGSSPRNLRLSKAKYEAVLKAIPDMILCVRRDGTYLEFKPAKDFGPMLMPDEFLGRKIRDVLPPELAEPAMEQLERSLRTQQVQTLEYQLPIDGAMRYFEARHVPYAEDEVLTIVRDVTESKRSAEALRASEERFRRTFEGTGVGIALCDLEGRSFESNARFQRFLGYTRDELRGMVFTEFTHPGDRDKIELFRETVAGRRDHFELEKRYIRKDGCVVWGHLNASLVRGSDGSPQYLVAMIEDITRRKEAEDALHASEERFRQSQKMEAMGRLAGGVAHDFNNLLTAILGYSELVLHQLDRHSPVRADVEEIAKSAERASSLTRQLLAFSRRQVLKPEILNLNEIVADISRMLTRVIGENIKLRTTLEQDPGEVKADPGQIEQVILNLALNARDAMADGGRLGIGTKNLHLSEPLTRDGAVVPAGSYVRLSVSDTGRGMDEETRVRIFEPFFTTKPKGTGLGLATVYGIVKQSGGYIWVDSKPGKGTTFEIDLPILARPSRVR